MPKRPKREICQSKKSRLKKGTDEDQWEDDDYDKDFSTRFSDRRCRKLFQCLNLKYCILGGNIIRVLSFF